MGGPCVGYMTAGTAPNRSDTVGRVKSQGQSERLKPDARPDQRPKSSNQLCGIRSVTTWACKAATAPKGKTLRHRDYLRLPLLRTSRASRPMPDHNHSPKGKYMVNRITNTNFEIVKQEIEEWIMDAKQGDRKVILRGKNEVPGDSTILNHARDVARNGGVRLEYRIDENFYQCTLEAI